MKKKLSPLERDTAAYFENMTEESSRGAGTRGCVVQQPQAGCGRARRIGGLDSDREKLS